MMRRVRGFTLVELMVAIAVVGVIAVVIYQLFDVTSQNFREVDQLADVNDRIRFAMERVRSHMQAAGAQGTPDSETDPWAPDQLTGGARVAGIVPYADWQDDRTVLPVEVATANPNVSFDGIIVVGAFDFPLAFEIAGLEDQGGDREARLYGHQRGVMKLMRQDPFVTGLEPTPVLNGILLGRIASTNWTTRLLRISDRQGYQQFVIPESLDGPEGTYPDDYFTIEVPADTDSLGPKFKVDTGGFFGLDDLPEGDTGYDAGLLDAFWIHVVPDPANPRVMSLVRDRLCASTVAQEAFATASWDPASAFATNCGATRDERVVIASYVADFQVWFDCADANGAVAEANWGFEWTREDHAAGGGDCMDENDPHPGQVRAAHVRLALHTQSERTDQAHTQFEDALGSVNSGARIDSAVLRTYDYFPDTVGASRVVVMQSDFELTNFVNRNAQ